MEVFIKVIEFIFKGPKPMFLFSVMMISFFVFNYLVKAPDVLSIGLASGCSFISWFIYEGAKSLIESQSEAYRAKKLQNIFYYKCNNIALTHKYQINLGLEKMKELLVDSLSEVNKLSDEQEKEKAKNEILKVYKSITTNFSCDKFVG